MARVSRRSAEIELPAFYTARTGFWFSLAAFATWFTMGIGSALRPLQDSRRETFWIVPFLLTFVAFACVHRVQRGRSRVELIGFVAVVIASLLLFVGHAGLQLHDHRLQAVGLPGGTAVWCLGLACFGAGTLIVRTLPRYAGIALICLGPAFLVGGLIPPPIASLLSRIAYTANFVDGFCMLVVALAMFRYSRSAAVQDACYSRLVSVTQGRGFSH